MTRSTAARVAGFALLFYIAVGIGAMGGLFHGPLAQAATYAQNASAVVLALTLFVVTRAEHSGVAAAGMLFRLAEGLLVPLLRLAAISVPHPPLVGATLFAIGSTLFCVLLLRGDMIPRPLAWTGVIASVILVVGLPLQLAGWVHAPLTSLMWLPMLAFEVPGGVWLLLKGVPPRRPVAESRW
jgi:hypothetical protein